MDGALIYLIKVNLVLSLLFAGWYFMMRKNKFFRQNRFALLAIIQISFILPFAHAIHPLTAVSPIPPETSDPARPDHVSITEKFRQVPLFYIKAMETVTGNLVITRVVWSAGILYLFISGLLLLRLLKQLLNVCSIIRKSRQVPADGVIYCESADNIAPFSFFNFIVVQKKAYSQEQYLQIISHEYVHSNEWHSVDTLLAELTQILLWPNPLAALLKHSLRSNLEFLTDDRVICSGIDQKSYQLNMLHLAIRPQPVSFTTGYGSLIVKERIRMINTSPTPSKRRYNSLLLLPCLVLCYDISSPADAHHNHEVLTADRQAELKAIGGYYRLKYHQDIFIRVSLPGDRLELVQQWDDQEIPFTKRSQLAFYNAEKKLRLDFLKDKDGKITGLIAMGKDRWIKLRDDDSM